MSNEHLDRLKDLIPTQTDLPFDPDDPNHHPVTTTFSANACHIAVCYSSGALVVYELDLPSYYYSAVVSSKSDAAAGAAAVNSSASGTVGTGDTSAQSRRNSGKLTLVVHMSISTVKGDNRDRSRSYARTWRITN
jgi:hypothetical protein